jgi:4-hydroxy-tetrahydrodipicolinate synthase
VIGQAIPADFSKMVQLGLAHQVAEAFAIHYRCMPIIDMIFEQGNPAGIKSMFESLGICAATVRLPLVPVNEDLANRIKSFVN